MTRGCGAAQLQLLYRRLQRVRGARAAARAPVPSSTGSVLIGLWEAQLCAFDPP